MRIGLSVISIALLAASAFSQNSVIPDKAVGIQSVRSRLQSLLVICWYGYS